MHELGFWKQSSEQTWEHQVYVLDCTTAWVCSDVPDAMLVKAQAASNCREGLQNRERDKDKWSTWEKKKKNIDSVSHMTRVVLVVSIQTVHQDGQNTRLDQVVYGRVAVTRQQLPARWGQQYSTVIEETLTKHWTVITKHHDEYEPLLTWRPERRWAECPGYHWSHSTNIHRDQTPHYTDKHSCSVQAISSRLLGWISWNVHVNES